MALNERDLALEPGDRAVAIGASRSGKSTLCSRLVEFWQEDYCHPAIPKARRGRTLILDEKPRFRATHSVIGPSIKRRYKHFVKGDTIRGVVLDDLAHWDLVWDPNLNPWQTVVCQAPDEAEAYVVALCVAAAALLYKTQKPRRPSLLYTDEGLSFFGPTGNGRYGSSIQKCFRAGGEKNLTSLLGSQRPRVINAQTMTESNKGYIFRLARIEDQKHLAENGFRSPPVILEGEEDNHKFWFYKGGRLLTGRPLKLPMGA